MSLKMLAFVALIGLANMAWAIDDEIVLKQEHPTQYTVKSGDTLWDIAARFLRDPWRWPDIWVVNPQIANPHLIYPGDEVVLTYKDGRPQLELRRGTEPSGTARAIKVEPRIRAMAAQGPIPTLAVETIAPMLNHPGVMSDREYDKLPYIASLDDQHLVGGAGQQVFARALKANDIITYRIIRRGQEYRDTKNKFLGVETLDVAEAVAERFGDPTTLRVTHSLREIRVGDRLVPSTARTVDNNFLPRAPDFPVDANIVGVVDGMARIGQYQIVAISAGTQQHLEPGHVLAIQRSTVKISDPINEADGPRKFLLPDRRAGYLVVFRPFEKVSYALVLVAETEIHMFDAVRTP